MAIGFLVSVNIRTLCIFLLAAALTGCGCAGVAFTRVSPAEQTIHVGESVTLQHETGGGCRSGDHLTDVETRTTPTVWHTSDTLVVRLDTLSGRVTGRTVGDAVVLAEDFSRADIHVR